MTAATTTIPLQPLRLDSLYLLQQLDHPAVKGGEMGPLPIAQLIYITAEPEGALEAFHQSPAALDTAAFKFCRQFPFGQIGAIVAEIVGQVTEATAGLSTPQAPTAPISQSTK